MLKLIDFKNICYLGGSKFRNLDKGSIEEETSSKYIEEICEELNIGTNNELSIKYDDIEKYSNESANKLSTQNKYISYLNIQEVKRNLIDIINILGISSITFYIDEWEKLYGKSILQKYSANYIDKMNGNPIYFWIAVVPWRGSLYNLVAGADLIHSINLDTSLIYEESELEKKKCIAYFKEFINRRLGVFLEGYNIDYLTLFTSDKVFEELVIASMGNNRDFGLMLAESIDNYLAYIKEKLIRNRTLKAISSDMIKKSISSSGRIKKKI